MTKVPAKVDDCVQMRNMMTVFLTAKVCDEVIKVVNVVYLGILVFLCLCICVFVYLCVFVFVCLLLCWWPS